MNNRNLWLILTIVAMFGVAIGLDIKNGVFKAKLEPKAKQESLKPKKHIQRPSSDEVPLQRTLMPITKPLPKNYRLKKEDLPPMASMSENVYIHIDGKKIPYEEYQKQMRDKQNVWLEKRRYEEYIKQCIIEKFGEENVQSPYMAQVIAKIKRNGDVECYHVSKVSWGRVQVLSEKTEIEKSLYKNKLEKAFLKAAPFQPFPEIISEEYMNIGVMVGQGNLDIVRHRGDFSKQSKKYLSFGKKRNSKKVEDVKITEAHILGRGYKTSGHYELQRLLLRDKSIDWTPVTTANNKVIVRGTLKDGKITDPVFIEKSNIKEANEAALDAFYGTRLPDLGKLKEYSIIKLEGVFTVK